jgi:hypothetical protein
MRVKKLMMRGHEDEFDECMSEWVQSDELALAYHALQYTRLDRTLQKNGVYRPRWQWWFPWSVTRWWLPRWFTGGDEWCNEPACLVIPPLGCFIVNLRPLRKMPCAEDWARMSDFERADYSPCGFLYDGRLDHSRHHHSFAGRLCQASQEWLDTRGEWQ